MLYLVSDLHLLESGTILSFYGPDFFMSDEAYEFYVLNRWRSKIKEDDTVIVVGDAGHPFKYKDLPGHKILVRGNHDVYAQEYYSVFEKVVDHIYLNVEGVRVVIEHICHSTDIEADILICGHSHNVSCYRYTTPEQTIVYVIINLLGYEPRTLSELLDGKYHNWTYELMQLRELIMAGGEDDS